MAQESLLVKGNLTYMVKLAPLAVEWVFRLNHWGSEGGPPGPFSCCIAPLARELLVTWLVSTYYYAIVMPYWAE